MLSFLLVLPVSVVTAQSDGNLNERDDYYVDRIKVDRYLDVEVWTDNADGDYYIGESVDISFRANRDAFVAIYSIDTRGRVNLLFPTSPRDDNFVYGGVAYSLPGPDDDYDLIVTGPEGVENIQIVASRERFSIPDWYDVSGIECDWDDRHDFMDYINSEYFVRYDGQRFAFDRTAMWVNEWEEYYYRPVYRPYYPSWTVCGNVYIDYPWGGTIYIDGVYWGVAPMYIPRVYVGWHTFTVYDHWGHCWEHDVHITHYHTLVLNHDVITPRPSVMSKYKEVRHVGYRDPGANGYPKYKEKLTYASKAGVVKTDADGRTGIASKKSVRSTSGSGSSSTTQTKRFVRGTSEVVSTSRGIETAGGALSVSKRSASKRSSTSGSVGDSKRSYDTDYGRSTDRQTRSTSVDRGSSSGNSSSGNSKRITTGTKTNTKSSSGYYQKKSGSQSKRKSNSGQSTVKTKSKKSETKSHSGNKRSSSVQSKAKKSGSNATVSSNRKSTPSKATAPKKSSSSSGGTSKAKSKGKSKR